MTSEEAYHIICNVFCKDATKQLSNGFLDVNNFGNFVIEFLDNAGSRAVICDRDQVHVCADSSGTQDCHLLVQSLYETTEQELLEAVQRVCVVQMRR